MAITLVGKNAQAAIAANAVREANVRTVFIMRVSIEWVGDLIKATRVPTVLHAPTGTPHGLFPPHFQALKDFTQSATPATTRLLPVSNPPDAFVNFVNFATF
jgi:hypothetical protein